MKKLFLLILIVSNTTIYSQTEKGKIVISGGTGVQFISSNLKYLYEGVTEEKLKTNSFTLLPSVGYFIIDNLAIGLAGNITSTSNKYDDGDKAVSTSILLFPVAIYYIPVDGDIKPIVQVGAGIASMTQKYTDEDKNSAFGFGFNFGAGIAYFVKENIALNIGLSYTLASLKDVDDENGKIKEGNLGANLGFSIFF